MKLSLSALTRKAPVSLRTSRRAPVKVYAFTKATEEARANLIRELYTKPNGHAIKKMTTPSFFLSVASKHVSQHDYMAMCDDMLKSFPDMTFKVTTDGKLDEAGFVRCTLHREGHFTGAAYAPYGSHLPRIAATGKFIKPEPVHLRVRIDENTMKIAEMIAVCEDAKGRPMNVGDALYLAIGGHKPEEHTHAKGKVGPKHPGHGHEHAPSTVNKQNPHEGRHGHGNHH